MNNQQDKIPQDSSRAGQSNFANAEQQDQKKKATQDKEHIRNGIKDEKVNERSSTEHGQNEENQRDL